VLARPGLWPWLEAERSMARCHSWNYVVSWIVLVLEAMFLTVCKRRIDWVHLPTPNRLAQSCRGSSTSKRCWLVAYALDISYWSWIVLHFWSQSKYCGIMQWLWLVVIGKGGIVDDKCWRLYGGCVDALIGTVANNEILMWCFSHSWIYPCLVYSTVASSIHGKLLIEWLIVYNHTRHVRIYGIISFLLCPAIPAPLHSFSSLDSFCVFLLPFRWPL
jgi:hypothetical protein